MMPVENFNPLLQGRRGVIYVHDLAQMPPSHGDFSTKIAA
jgi:hypothetical protein